MWPIDSSPPSFGLSVITTVLMLQTALFPSTLAAVPPPQIQRSARDFPPGTDLAGDFISPGSSPGLGKTLRYQTVYQETWLYLLTGQVTSSLSAPVLLPV